MSDNLFSAVLTFGLLAAGTAAVGTELVAPGRISAKHHAVATLPPVTVVGKRAAADKITLPMVTVTGCRQVTTEVALDQTRSERRVQ